MACLLPPLPVQDHLHNTPKQTFYVTTVHELRADMDQYMYSIDRCHTNLEQANERLSLLSRCNTNPARREVLSAGIDRVTGGRWCAWSRNLDMPDDGKKDGGKASGAKFRFLAEVKPIVMHGSLLTTGPSEDAFSPLMAASTTMTEVRYLFERRKDLAFHVWAVAIHHAGRHRSIEIGADGQPTNLPWSLESVHPVSGNALARAKRLWTEELLKEKGRFDRLDLHYGFARYILLPLSTTVKFVGKTPREIMGLKVEMESQVRVERIKVTPEWEMAAPFAPAEAILPTRPFQALCPERAEKAPLGENVGFSVLEKEFDDIFKDFTVDGFDEKEEEAASSSVTEDEDDKENKSPSTPKTPLFLPFVGQPHIGTQRAPFRPNVVGEYGTLALQMREKQEERMEEIVNKAHASNRWSIPRPGHVGSLRSFFGGGPSSSPSAAEFAAAVKGAPSAAKHASSTKRSAGLRSPRGVDETGSPRQRKKTAASSREGKTTTRPREVKNKAKVRFALDEQEVINGLGIRGRVSVRGYNQDIGSKRVSYMGALM